MSIQSVYVQRLPSFCVACVALYTHTSPLDTNKTLKRGCSATTTGSSNFRVENEEHMFVCLQYERVVRT